MYEPEASDAELAAWGLQRSDYADKTTEVWPENWPTYALWSRICNQWRVGMAGAIALDYGVLFHELDRAGLDAEEYDERFRDIQVIESEALTIFAERAEHAKGSRGS
ncbi:DUF1799 domain-containing protein [Paracidovorax citrulli]|uniref:DUF1799 domain-containing protein n=2 Tax=Paracidovorax citrulli TaxID=80869 RepID=A1TN28_PARC0|nr:DUF1799 domain-containing protein [Paracidovorax citrulli]ABM32366.1 conserved hypothetical protein [Paracidovorax citrulli AAC00-1]ATG94614.1 hypothetical protein CQB05_11755 [Paracidovorax citrulli]MVT28503.1 hypothetical protein [Paracidovorax citrulli]PVY66581.1 uncharacterized protein DUF1799 [Paracidovorax citrulli]REG69252.1 uncharacterized protein DUF1799 [Paracidovorax citrulli]